MRKTTFLIASVATALGLSAPAEAQHRHYHHHHGNGAAVGAALGAGIFLGALAGTAAANAREPVYVEELPPPPLPVPEHPFYTDRGEDANEAIDACRRGLLDAARKYGAFDAEIGDIYSVRETEFGHRVRAEVTIDYPDYSRTSVVTCRTENGLLVSARSEY